MISLLLWLFSANMLPAPEILLDTAGSDCYRPEGMGSSGCPKRPVNKYYLTSHIPNFIAMQKKVPSSQELLMKLNPTRNISPMAREPHTAPLMPPMATDSTAPAISFFCWSVMGSESSCGRGAVGMGLSGPQVHDDG